MSIRLQAQVRKNSAWIPAFPPAQIGLQRKCASNVCEDQRKKKPTLQRSSTNQAEPFQVPSIVHEVLSSPGQPLDPATRAFMEPRFGHDFSKVRVHTDEKAVKSTQAVDSLAYTVGRDIVFGQGQYTPQTVQGQRLLAHELTHVLQQSLQIFHAGNSAELAAEKEATQNAQRVLKADSKVVQIHAPAVGLQRQQSSKDQTTLDQTAEQIIAIAQNDKRDIKFRAIEVVFRIISAYYSADASIINGVSYEEKLKGLSVNLKGSGASTRAIISVGEYFVQNTNRNHFARRVLQVGHEIEHIRDWRAGMAGKKHSDEREFRAFYHAAIATEMPHTGRMQHSNRVSQIDAALGYYNCLNQDLQQKYANEYQNLLTRRPIEIQQSGHTASPAPTSCVRSSN